MVNTTLDDNFYTNCAYHEPRTEAILDVGLRIVPHVESECEIMNQVFLLHRSLLGSMERDQRVWEREAMKRERERERERERGKERGTFMITAFGKAI